MSASTSDELTAVFTELRAVFPEMRLGQLVLNLASAAGVSDPAGVWDVEDDVLLVAARRLLDRNRGRAEASQTLGRT